MTFDPVQIHRPSQNRQKSTKWVIVLSWPEKKCILIDLQLCFWARRRTFFCRCSSLTTYTMLPARNKMDNGKSAVDGCIWYLKKKRKNSTSTTKRWRTMVAVCRPVSACCFIHPQASSKVSTLHSIPQQFIMPSARHKAKLAHKNHREGLTHHSVRPVRRWMHSDQKSKAFVGHFRCHCPCYKSTISNQRNGHD